MRPVAGVLSRWLLRNVIARGLAFEREAIDAYRALEAGLREPGRCADPELEGILSRLREEEQLHERILSDAAVGRLSVEELERARESHRHDRLNAIRPLPGEEAERWRPLLAAALEQEEETWIFYGNLGRMGTMPAMKKAFEVVAAMEKEHVDILRMVLGIAGSAKA